MSFNKVIIVGNVGKEAVVRYTEQGTPVCEFTVATNERRKDAIGETEAITTWFRVALWGKQAENIARYLTRGKLVFVEGRLRVEEWTDREGKDRYTLKVTATDVRLLGTKVEKTVGEDEEIEVSEETSIRDTDFEDEKEGEDEIPF